ncbi:hypothetical protein AB5J49_25585 [Streptomyces sp. R28]|uniref:Uncharacterized protein n=1 Tax=Streptomyces sp. R28 TaxID=3238628 RepID=A0AB39Q1T1_9ACTN
MTCGTRLDVPEGMRAAALDVAGGVSDDAAPLPGSVACELGKHDHREHIGRLRELFGGAVWVMWEGEDITVRPLAYCESSRPSQDGISLSDALCWLPDSHRGGHTWERCA